MPKPCMVKKMLVTGAAGFIGSHLCCALSGAGSRVVACDLPRVDWWRHDELGVKAERTEADLSEARAVAALARRGPFDTVFHLASTVDVRRDEDLVSVVLDSDVRAASLVLRTFAHRVRRMVLAGTCEEYGDGPAPFKETQRESAVSPYAWAKLCVTHLGQLYAKVFGAPVVVVRPFLTYGPLQTGDMLVPAAIRAALSNQPLHMTKGEQAREFMFVDDTVAGLAAVAKAPGVTGKIVNLGSGRETRVADAVTLIYDLCRARTRPRIGTLPYRPGETMHFFSSTTFARRVLCWRPRIRLEAGLRRTVEWYRDHLSRHRATRT